MDQDMDQDMDQETRKNLDSLLRDIRACRQCAEAPMGAPLPHAPRPALRVSATARLLVAGQAPGARVHNTGLPFNDPSGDRLRDWMGIDRETFYDGKRIAIVPMGFCFPGQNAAGADLPPRPECRARWHEALFSAAPTFDLVLAIGRYAQDYHLGRLGLTLPKGLRVSETVARWREFSGGTPKVFPLPHPSWRNTGWLKRHPWFEAELLPELRKETALLLGRAASRSNLGLL